MVAYVGRALYMAATLMASLIGGQALAKGTALLPGGAQNLQEGYGDWVMSCDIRSENNVSRKVCGLSQQQTNTQSHQRVLLMQLQPKGAAAEGTLVLPFGPDLSKGISLQIDSGAVFASLPLSGCRYPDLSRAAPCRLRRSSPTAIANCDGISEPSHLPSRLAQTDRNQRRSGSGTPTK